MPTEPAQERRTPATAADVIQAQILLDRCHDLIGERDYSGAAAARATHTTQDGTNRPVPSHPAGQNAPRRHGLVRRLARRTFPAQHHQDPSGPASAQPNPLRLSVHFAARRLVQRSTRATSTRTASVPAPRNERGQHARPTRLRRRYQPHSARRVHPNHRRKRLVGDPVRVKDQHNSVVHAHDPEDLPGTVSATYVLAHSNKQDQQRSNRAGVVFAPTPP